MKDIFALRLYTRVARLGSFSAAARECGLSQSQASRIVADLEADLGTRLLSRSTRAVVPTEAGARPGGSLGSAVSRQRHSCAAYIEVSGSDGLPNGAGSADYPSTVYAAGPRGYSDYPTLQPATG